jgi:DNA-binding PadR family transcriptional regulator
VKTPTPESLLPLPSTAFHILVALAGEDRHGYAIIKEVGGRTDGALKLSAGTLYRTIDRLLNQGLIREVSGRPGAVDDERRRYYRLTPFGRTVVIAETRRLAELVAFAHASGLKPRRT